MLFCFTDNQLLFASAVKEMLAKECTPAHVREYSLSESGTLPDLWKSLSSMGVIGMAGPESHGGMEMVDVDFVLMMEELGRAACPETVIEQAVLAVPLLAKCAASDRHHDLLKSLIKGTTRAAVSIDSPYVRGADIADHFFIFRNGQLHLVGREDVTLQRQESVDETRRLFSAEWNLNNETVIEANPEVVASLASMTRLRAQVAVAALCIGVADHLLGKTVEYVKQREQFGKPIGVHQAVKHQLADTGKAIEFARPMVYRAAWCLSNEDPEIDHAVAIGKLLASRAVELACRSSLQCHGAIAYTVEYDLQIWIKRGLALSASWGNEYTQSERIAKLLGI